MSQFIAEPNPDTNKRKEPLLNSSFNIEQLSRQIQSTPFLIKQALESDRILLDHLQNLTERTKACIMHFNEQKQTILTRFDNWLAPLASEVLDEFIKQAQLLKNELDETLLNLRKIDTIDWDKHANSWLTLYHQWSDHKELNKKILKLVSDRTEHLIDKDLKLIKEYQIQYLSKMEEEDPDLINLENRLAKAIEEPLKHLVELKTHVKNAESMQQASEWIEKLDSQRENCFDQLLMKIDSVVKEVVLPEAEISSEDLKEVENEMHFVAQELKHIHELLPKLDKHDEKEFYFTEVRLEGLRDHLEQFDSLKLPIPTRDRLETLFATIEATLSEVLKRNE
ncbi:hypothetical protein [Candidatus Protochlamydia sp. W-9]|uniref:hypothetical protein n=1 Tax=Candidatus Protochlamydia sp. W-9 TaxID=1785087 RepID=UPI00096A2AC8|nr:hypothetical protein [Candidatus Protochlamydia sp. W-9]